MMTTRTQEARITTQTLRAFAAAASWQFNVAIFLFYLLLAIIITFPLILNIGSVYAGYPDSDAYEMARHVWWFKTALQTGQPIFFQPLLGYPDGIAGVSLWANPLQFFPMWLFAFVLPLPVAYNLTLLLTLALNGLALYWMLWRLLGWGALSPLAARIGAIIGGVIFMAHPIFQGHLAGGHAGLLVLYAAPLWVYALFKLRAIGRWASLPKTVPLHLPDTPPPPQPKTPSAVRRATIIWIVFGALFFMLTPGGHALQAIYVLLPIGTLFGLRLIAERNWAGLWRVIVMAALGSAGLLIFLLPSISDTLAAGDAYALNTNVRYSTDLLGIVAPSFNHPLYGQWDYTHRVLGVNIVEGSAYAGILATILAVVGIWKLQAARWWLLLALVAWVLSLGPLLKVFDQPVSIAGTEYATYVPLPYALIENLPIISLARTPGRFTFTVALALAVMAGAGMAWLAERIFRRSNRARTQLQRAAVAPIWGAAAVVCGLILFDYQSFWALPTVDAIPPDAVSALAIDDTIRAVYNVPWENVLAAKEALWLQTAHGQPMIAGHVTRQTPVDPAKLSVLQGSLDPALLDAAGADVIIVHRAFDPDNYWHDRLRVQFGGPLYEDQRFSLFRTGDAGVVRTQSTQTPDTDATVIAVPSAELSAPITNRASMYLYTPTAGWVKFSATVSGEADSVLLLNGTQIHAMPTGAAALAVPLPAAGYHTLTIALSAPCPLPPTESLTCRSISLDTPTVTPELVAGNFSATAFEQGVTLLDGTIGPVTEEAISVYLWWQFDQPRGETDVRFVHIVDEAGELAAQEDIPPGAFDADTQWAETVTLDIANLPSGRYEVYTGWYSYPDIVPFAVLEDGAGRVAVGRFTR